MSIDDGGSIFDDYTGPDNPTGREWLNHLDQSPYCYRNCSMLHVQGRDVCQCGWHGPIVPTGMTNGMTFGDLMATKGYKYDGHSRHECEEHSLCPQHRTQGDDHEGQG